MACYSIVTVPEAIQLLRPTPSETAEVLKRMGLPQGYNLGYLRTAQVQQFKRELNAVRVTKAAYQQGYKNVREERKGNQIIIRAMD